MALLSCSWPLATVGVPPTPSGVSVQDAPGAPHSAPHSKGGTFTFQQPTQLPPRM